MVDLDDNDYDYDDGDAYNMRTRTTTTTSARVQTEKASPLTFAGGDRTASQPCCCRASPWVKIDTLPHAEPLPWGQKTWPKSALRARGAPRGHAPAPRAS